MKKAMKFLKSYKGKKADMKIDKKLASMQEAENLVLDAHETYKGMHSPMIKKATQQTATKNKT